MNRGHSRRDAEITAGSPSPVRGVSVEQQMQSVEQFFAHFPWQPSAHTVLAHWDSARFFETFVR